MGAVSGLNAIAPAFTRITGDKLIILQESRAELEQRLMSNAPADLIVQTTSVMDSVIGRGKVVEGSSAVFARAAVGLSVKSGAPWPDISTPEAFKRTLLGARSICYSFGGSGIVAARTSTAPPSSSHCTRAAPPVARRTRAIPASSPSSCSGTA